MFSGSFNERDQLEEVIIGTAINARLPTLGIDQIKIEYGGNMNKDSINIGNFPNHIIEETEEDLENLCLVLRELGITVHRPKIIDHSKYISTGDRATDSFYNYCPRDSILVIGNKIIETPMTMRSRFVEQFSYKDILLECFHSGAEWISAPKPQLLDDRYQVKEEIVLDEYEPIFDAANILRAGKDVFYLHSNTGNLLGAKWLQSILGEKFNVNVCKNIYSGIHIDSTISLLRPGLVLLNPSRIQEKNIPEKLKKWDKIWCPNLVDTHYSKYRPLSSIWVGMNLLMINPNLAIVDQQQQSLIKVLEKKGITVYPLKLRNARLLGGGFHCVSLDLKRKNSGVPENYF